MVMRSTGLSGLDTESMMKSIMDAKRAPLNSIKQKKTLVEWKKSEYNSIYNSIRDFRSKTLLNYKLSSYLKPKAATTSDSDLVTATASSDAGNMTHKIHVDALATTAQVSSSAKITDPAAPDKTTISNQFNLGLAGSTTWTFSVRNSGSDTTYKNITIDPYKESIYDLASKISTSGIGIGATYDSTTDRFFTYTNVAGATQTIDFAGTAGATEQDFITNKLKLGAYNTVATGSNAKFYLDWTNGALEPDPVLDANFYYEQSNNSFAIAGVSYNLKSVSAINTYANVTVSSDVDTAVNNIKSFVEDYNKILDTINTKVKEPRYKDYLPLNDVQKESMKESEITAWEAKAKSGMLNNNQTLRQLVDKMRTDLSTAISGMTGSYNSASALGITTGSYTEGGKLYLNESKLRTALSADPESVYKVFGTKNSTDTGNSYQGIAVRLYDNVKSYLDTIKTEAGTTATFYDSSYLGKLNSDYYNKITTMEKALTTTENRYYQRFAAIEKAISQMNAQGSWLSQQLS